MSLKQVSRLLQRQDVCLFCSLRQTVEAQTSRRQFIHQSRSYQSTAPSLRAASATALAEKDDDDEFAFPMLRDNAASGVDQPIPERRPPPLPRHRRPNPYEAMPDWRCGCGHFNLPNKSICTMCNTHKPSNPQLHHYPQADDRYSSTNTLLCPKPREPHFRTQRGSSSPLSGEDRNPRVASWPTPWNSGDRNIREDLRARGSSFQSRGLEEPGYETGTGQFGSLPELTQKTPANHWRSPDTTTSRPRQSRIDAGVRSLGNSAASITKSRFGSFIDNAISQTSPNIPRPHNDKGAKRSRFGAMVDSIERPLVRRVDAHGTGVFGINELEKTAVPRHQPPPPSNSKGMGVFGLDELERVAGSKDTSVDTRARRKGNAPGPFDRQEQQNSRYGRSQDAAPEILPPASGLGPSSFGAGDRRSRVREEKAERRNRRFDLADEEGSINAVEDQNKKGKPLQRKTFQEVEFDFEDDIEDLLEEGRRKKKKKAKVIRAPAYAKPQVELPEFISVEKLAQALKVKLDSFLQKLEEEGFEGARYDHILDAENSAMFADLYGFEPVFGKSTIEDLVAQPPAEDKSLLPPRPPIVTIMGHVDHGKTTILDWLRKSSVVETEHGGITQHIGAFSFSMPGSDRQITFLDTPGHAAFLDMRRRGANVTDIVVLVVAADDSVKPQTLEAIKHALDARVQIIVAINKIDKPDANIERVKQDLAQHDVVVEDYGGEYQAIALSGKTGQGMADLEEAILTLADVSDFRAEVDIPAEGWVIESKVTIAGRVATILVHRGTLRPGDIIVAGTTWSRVRTLRNDAGNLVYEAPPGTPVQVDGWRGDPTAGLQVLGAEDEEHAKSVVELRLEKKEMMRTSMDMAAINNARTEEAEARARVLEKEAEQKRSFESSASRRYFKQAKDNEGWVEGEDSSGPKKVHFLVKADVTGSVEALVAAVSAVGNNEISANIIHSGAGLLTESDIRHLAATGETSYAISFNQAIDPTVARLAHSAGVQILDHNIIYKVTDDVKSKLSDALPPLVTQKVLGEAEIGQIFEISTKKGKMRIAGCRISNGTIDRSHQVRVLRNGEMVYTGTLDSLKNVKKDVTDMRKGSECGMGFDNWADFEVGDQIQCFERKEEKRTLY